MVILTENVVHKFYSKVDFFFPFSIGKFAFIAGINGTIAGIIAKLGIYPLDTVKKRLQVSTFISSCG